MSTISPAAFNQHQKSLGEKKLNENIRQNEDAKEKRSRRNKRKKKEKKDKISNYVQQATLGTFYSKRSLPNDKHVVYTSTYLDLASPGNFFLLLHLLLFSFFYSAICHGKNQGRDCFPRRRRIEEDKKRDEK